jgi:hypothetical protein
MQKLIRLPNWILLVAITASLSSTLSSTLQAELALDFVGTAQNGFQANNSFGWSFTVTTPVRIEGLGFFDDFIADGEGLRHDHLIRLWTDDRDNHEMLASSLIDNTSLPMPSTAEDGRWLFNMITPLILPPGDYVIGADDPGCTNDCDSYRFLDVASTIPEITFGENRASSPVGFPRFTVDGRNDGYFGPNFLAVPLSGPDLNRDDLVDCADVDSLVAAIVANSNDVLFDLTGDAIVNQLDLDEWLRQAGGVNLTSGGAYLYGDANLDGGVDVADFNIWNGNKFTGASGWCSGDFNADGFVDVSDFNLWNVNKFSAADRAVTVPEPSAILLSLAFAAAVLAFRR